MIKSFEQLGIIASLVRGLKNIGIKTPTDIQSQIIPLALDRKNVVGQSATGTGKTLAYILPIIQNIDIDKREVQSIILAPTHELAIQIERQIEEVVKNAGLMIRSASIIGNVNIVRQIEKLKEKPHIIVGSSGRILELIQKRKISAQTVKTVVLDEADRLLDEKNFDSVNAVIKTTLRDRQLMMFSATMSAASENRIRELMPQPVIVNVKNQVMVPEGIEHMYFVTEQRDKVELLRKLIRNLEVKRALVFVKKSDEIDIITAKLNYHGLKAVGLKGNSLKNDRKEAIESFRRGKIQLLVASDLAARGLDIPGVTHVFNFDLPEEPQVYLHRVGRTGRAGQSGTAISLVTKYEVTAIKKLEKIFKLNITAKNIIKGKVIDAAERHKQKHPGLK